VHTSEMEQKPLQCTQAKWHPDEKTGNHCPVHPSSARKPSQYFIVLLPAAAAHLLMPCSCEGVGCCCTCAFSAW
jgi:hypothetical protein